MAQHQKTMPKSEAGYTCAVGTGAKVTGACNEGESIYGLIDHYTPRQPAFATLPRFVYTQ